MDVLPTADRRVPTRTAQNMKIIPDNKKGIGEIDNKKYKFL